MMKSSFRKTLLIGVVALDFAGGRITGIDGVVNPDKLTHLGPVAAGEDG